MKTAIPLLALTLALGGAVSAQDGAYIDTGAYVDTGPYQGGIVETVPAPTYETEPVYAAPETTPIYVEPTPIYAVPEMAPVHAAPEIAPVYADPVETIAISPYRAPIVLPADTGWADAEYERDRLAAYDADGDGTISTREAIAGLRPLTGRN